MTKITDDQKYGMIDAISHLIHRDYSEIGNDFVKLDFIPAGVDTAPIVPALSRYNSNRSEIKYDQCMNVVVI